MGKRILVLVYGVACYLAFLATFLYAIGFIGNFGVPNSMDSTPRIPLGEAVAINVGLLALFAVQHSVMARRWFKAWWTRIVPEAVERSTYVLFSNLALGAMFVFWEPMGGEIWNVQSPTGRAVIYGVYALGVGIVLAATFLINHFDLFGLRQVWLYFRRQSYTHPEFRTPGMYKVVRHPLYFGWLLTFWATPTMTAAHLLFAAMTTAYILVAIQFEERDLEYIHGDDYRQYKERVPMILPGPRTAESRIARQAAGTARAAGAGARPE